MMSENESLLFGAAVGRFNRITKEQWKKFGVAVASGLLVIACGGILIGTLTATHSNIIIPTTTPYTSTTFNPTKNPTTNVPATSTTTNEPQPTGYPPTKRPLPPNADSMNAISLLNYMEIHPNFTEIKCQYAVPPVFKFNITIDNEFTFTSLGGDTKKEAKEGAAMTACEHIFPIHFKKPIPQPTNPCTSDFN